MEVVDDHVRRPCAVCPCAAVGDLASELRRGWSLPAQPYSKPQGLEGPDRRAYAAPTMVALEWDNCNSDDCGRVIHDVEAIELVTVASLPTIC
jgi:hypothetical protein